MTNPPAGYWIGKQIQWSTPSKRRIAPGKFDNVRQGYCLDYIPPGEQLYNNPHLKGITHQQLKAGNGYGESVNPRLLVRVDRTSGGKQLKPYYYCPRVSSVIGEVSLQK